MPRSRMVRPEFFDDEKLSTIPLGGRLTFIGLWVQSDDYGVVKGHHRWLQNQIFPYGDVTPKDFDLWMTELTEMDFIRPFDDHGERYYWIRNFLKHQKVNRPSETRNPPPPESLIDGSVSPQLPLMDETEVKQKQKQKQKQKGSVKGNGKTFLPSNFHISDQVRKWAGEQGHTHLEAHLESFIDYAQSNGKQYVDWDSAFKRAIRENWGKIDFTKPEPPKLRRVCPTCGAWEDKCLCKAQAASGSPKQI